MAEALAYRRRIICYWTQGEFARETVGVQKIGLAQRLRRAVGLLQSLTQQLEFSLRDVVGRRMAAIAMAQQSLWECEIGTSMDWDILASNAAKVDS